MSQGRHAWTRHTNSDQLAEVSTLPPVKFLALVKINLLIQKNIYALISVRTELCELNDDMLKIKSQNMIEIQKNQQWPVSLLGALFWSTSEGRTFGNNPLEVNQHHLEAPSPILLSIVTESAIRKSI